MGRGFRFSRGEIDIIAREGNTLVFLEVKTRIGVAFGRPEESVTSAKQEQIRKVARGYLQVKKMRCVNCRFDVISILFHDEKIRVEHFKNAF